MNKLIKDLKVSRYTTFAIIGFMVLILLCALLYNFVMPSTGTPVYGNRLDGIEDVEITTKDLKDLEAKFEKNSNVSEADVSISGKTVNAIVTVDSKTSVNNAKKLASILTDFLDEDQVKFYDLQIFIKNEDKKNKKYPIIGYKNIKNSGFSYSYSK